MTLDATQASEACASGQRLAVPELIELVYDSLRRIAAAYLKRERVEHTLEPAALVNEAYLRLIDQTRISWQGRTHFLAIAAKQMRRILVESARAHRAGKRSGRLQRVLLDEIVEIPPELSPEILALDEALESLAKLSPRQAAVVELRFFAGLSVAEVAYLQGVSERTVKQDWRIARAYLLRELSRAAVR